MSEILKLTHYPNGRWLDNRARHFYHQHQRFSKLFTGGFEEIAFILFIAFLLFGPKKLPEIARLLGKGLGDLRRASSELRFSLEDEIRNLSPGDDASQERKALSPLEELRHTSRELMTTLEDEIRSLEHEEHETAKAVTPASTGQNGQNGPTAANYVHDDSESAPPKLGS